MDRRRRIFSESGRALPDSRQRAAGVLVRQRGTVDQTLFQRQRSAGAGTAETLFAGKCPADPQFSRPERFADGLPAPPQNWTKCPVLRIFRHFFPRKTALYSLQNILNAMNGKQEHGSGNRHRRTTTPTTPATRPSTAPARRSRGAYQGGFDSLSGFFPAFHRARTGCLPTSVSRIPQVSNQ